MGLGHIPLHMFEVLVALDGVGYDGGLNPDHWPRLAGNSPDGRMALAYLEQCAEV